ncbi:MAG: carboxymuconolactone decarboxylase family protein [Anaerolineae bacterium]
MKPFKRRRYHALRDILTDLQGLFARRKEMAPLMQGHALAPAFRERLMMVVTEVNACRYCAYYHARQALVEGIEEEELTNLAAGEFGESPAEERAALLYAQHFADSNGVPEPAARARLVAIYGAPNADAIELTLRIIRTANLLGNTFDYLLYRLTFGHLGA